MAQPETGVRRTPGALPAGPERRPGTPLVAGANAAVALSDLVAAQLEGLRAHERRVREREGEEALHDLRVVLRRLRTLLRSARSWVEDTAPELVGDLAEASERLRWLARLTGEVRDLDVLLLRLADDSGTPTALLEIFAERRNAASERLVSTLVSPRQQALHASVARLLAKARSLPEHPDRPTTAAFAGRCIRRAGRRLLDHAAALSEPTANTAALHQVRIDGKRLRYLLDLFGSLYPLEALSALLDPLAQLQKQLGAFHDAEVQRQLLGEAEPELARAARQRCAARARRRRKASLRAWQQIEPHALRGRLEQLTAAGAAP